MFFTHEIQTGETLESLAQRFDTTVEEIMNYNEIRNPARIAARTVIIIPAPILPPTVPSPRPPANFSVRVIRGLLYVLSTDRMLYRRNQPVRITLVKTNVADVPIALRYPTAQRFDFYVRRSTAGRVLWQWSGDRVFAQVVERITLQPEQSQVFRATWDQRTNEGELVGTGVFTVQGENIADELRNQRISLRIRIV